MQHGRTNAYALLLFFVLIDLNAFAQQKDSVVTTHRFISKSISHNKSNGFKKSSQLNSDQLIKAAKTAAFKQRNYSKAKSLLFKAEKRSPNYADVQIFLGRIYGWTNQPDSARFYFEKVLNKNSKNEDAAIAYSDLEYNFNNNDRSLQIINNGLRYHPKSVTLLKRRRRILSSIKNSSARSSFKKTAPSTITDIAASTNKDSTGHVPAVLENKSVEQIDTTLTNAPSVNQKIDAPVKTVQLDTSSSDDLIILARKAAFDEKNYDKAKGFLYRAYNQSPAYADVQIFLGRIYTWTNNYDSARFFFNNAISLKPDYEDAINAYSDMEYWNDHYALALSLVESGLRYHPSSEDLLLRKAKILTALKQYKEAESTLNNLLKINYKNASAIELHDRIRELSIKNDISVGYDFSYFNKEFDNPWHLLELEYGRVTGIGKIIARVNLANRFATNGAQFEMDAYPHISKTFYAYMNFGVPLNNVGIFPVFRGGFSLYANLPASFEGELGFRYLKFTGNPVFIYVASLGKYVKNWLFNEKLYLVPSDFSHTISASFTLTASYYIGGSSADDVIGADIGYGISPDDRANNIQLNTTVERLGSYKVGIFYKRKFSKFDVLSLSQGIIGREYLPGVHGTEYQFSISVRHDF